MWVRLLASLLLSGNGDNYNSWSQTPTHVCLCVLLGDSDPVIGDPDCMHLSNRYIEHTLTVKWKVMILNNLHFTALGMVHHEASWSQIHLVPSRALFTGRMPSLYSFHSLRGVNESRGAGPSQESPLRGSANRREAVLCFKSFKKMPVLLGVNCEVIYHQLTP